MSTWDIQPWDNDEGADWYSEMMKSCKIRSKWLEGMEQDVTYRFDTVRAAVGFFLLLGRVYVWPIENFDNDLDLAILKCKELKNVEEYQDYPDLLEQIDRDLEELESRKNK